MHVLHYPVLALLCAVITGAAGSREVCVAAQRPSACRQQRIHSVTSAVDSDCSRTAPSTTAALCSCSSVKFPNFYRVLTTLGTLLVTTCESASLQVAANADVDPTPVCSVHRWPHLTVRKPRSVTTPIRQRHTAGVQLLSACRCWRTFSVDL